MHNGKGRTTFTGGSLSGEGGYMRAAVIFCLAVFFMMVISTVCVHPTDAEDCNCAFCHGGSPHSEGWQGCSSCHDSPPQTGSHLTHYGSGPVTAMAYGDTSMASDANNYMFGCGNCHPLDNSKHQNGYLDVELYNPLAPVGSVKAKNPSTAAFTPGTYVSYVKGSYTFSYSNGTCANVYCHSGYTLTSGSVGNPLTTANDPALFPAGYKINNGYIMDETCSSLQYAPYTVTTQRVYKTTPAWGTTGTFTACIECHAFPLTTWDPTVKAGVGDTHQWVNEYAYNYGHAYNMGYFGYGIPCATCHYGTANHRGGVPPAYPQTLNAPTYWTTENGASIVAYYPVQLRSRALHVNGSPDVVFDVDNGYTYYYDAYGWYINNHYDLQGATYDPATKTCSNVACHFNPSGPVPNWQQKVKWGSPYRGWEGPGEECDQCHRNGYLNEICQ